MAIVSLSLPDQMVEAMDELQRTGGFTGRSELVRAAIREMLEETKEREAMKGPVSAILIVTHDKRDEGSVTGIKHRFEEIVKTHVHSKVTRDDCVELFLVQGDAQKVVEMSKAFRAQDKMKSARFMAV